MATQARTIDRRDFLKGAAIAGAAVTATSALPAAGIAEEGASSTDAGETNGVGMTSTTLVAAEGIPAELPQPPHISDDQVTQTIDTDVVVVGAGVSGIAAARSAAEAGAKVVVLEKKDAIEVHGFQMATLNCSIEREAGATEDPAAFLADYQRRSAQRANMALIKLWAENSGDVFDWWIEPVANDESVMSDITICYWPRHEEHDRAGDLEQTYIGTMDFKEDPANPIGGAAWLATGQANADAAATAGAQFIFNVAGRELIQDETGRVTGIYAVDAGGNYTKITASKGVILCTGGLTNLFGAGAEELMKYYCPTIVRNYVAATGSEPAWEPMFTPGSTVLCGATGDGNLMAIWVGGHMERNPEAGLGCADTLLGGTVCLEVNINGNRVQNEDVGVWPKYETVASLPGRCVWQIFDSNWQNRLPYQGIGHRNLDPSDEPYKTGYTGNEYIAAIDATLRESVGKGTEGAQFADAFNECDGMCYGANTLEELAEIIGVPADTLQATVERYNQMASQGKDDDFGLDPQKLFPIDTPPFFAAKASAGAIMTCMSGLQTDGKLAVVDAQSNPIPGLWCAGTTCGQRFQPYYQTPMSGLNHGYAIVHGYFAGQYAAQA